MQHKLLTGSPAEIGVQLEALINDEDVTEVGQIVPLGFNGGHCSVIVMYEAN